MRLKLNKVKTLVIVLGLLALASPTWPSAAQVQTPLNDEPLTNLDPMRVHRVGAPRLQLPHTSNDNLTTPQAIQQWDIQWLDPGNIRRYNNSLVVDRTGLPQFTYANYGVHYSYYDGASWQTEQIAYWPHEAGSPTALALDAAGHAQISYIEIPNHIVTYGFRDNLGWHLQNVDTGNPSASFFSSLSMALDSAGWPHLIYASNELKYAFQDASGWHVQTVASGSGNLSLALDADGWPHIAYTDGGLKYAYQDAAGWHIQAVTTLTDGPSLVLDTAGQPHIAYCDGLYRDLKYASLFGGVWQIQTVESGAYAEQRCTTPPQLMLDTNNQIHIAYGVHVNGLPRLRYAKSNLGGWHFALFDYGIGNSYISLALDRTNHPHLVASPADGYYAYYIRQITAMSDWSKLTFASYRNQSDFEIYSADGDGSAPTRLTSNGNVDYMPAYSRGTNKIAFVSRRDGNYEIYTMNPDGSGQTRLTFTGESDYRPQWSPDGSKITFYSYRDGNPEVYVMSADGNNQVRLAATPGWDGQPAWSPDGTKLVFTSDRSGADQYELWIMNADGSNPQRLTNGVLYANFPNWSPDGNRITFNDDANNDGWLDLAVVNVDGTGLTHPLGGSPTGYENFAPTWAPNGQDLAYSQIQYTNYQGNYYWVSANIKGLDTRNNSTYPLVSSSYDWWPSWQTTDTSSPTSQISVLPPYTGSPTFTVQWAGSDAGGAGQKSYDIQYRDGGNGNWTDWLIGAPQTQALWTGQEGHTYYFRSRARDYAYNLEAYPSGEGDTFSTIDLTAPTSTVASLASATTPNFQVAWSGSDNLSGVSNYDLQVRDGPSGAWTDWLTNTKALSAYFVGQLGHTYYFQSRAHDVAGNVEAYPGGNGDTFITTPLYAASSVVLGNRDQPVFQATVQGLPLALNTATTDQTGAYSLYFNQLDVYTVTVSRSGFGMLPPVLNATISGTLPTFYLPPVDDHVLDGNFETGNLEAWGLAGQAAPTITTTAHTGHFAALLGGPIPAPVVTSTSPFTASIVLTESGGSLVAASPLTIEVPAWALTQTTTLTLTAVPTITNLLSTTQDVGLHFSVTAVLSDGAPLTATLSPMTLTVAYTDDVWRAAQVAGEESLALWQYDDTTLTWLPLAGIVDPVSHTVTAATNRLGLFALLGAPYPGPWISQLEQAVSLTPGSVTTGTLSLVYNVVGANPASDSLQVYLVGTTQTLTYTLPLTTTGWVHRWWEVPGSFGSSFIVRVSLAQGERSDSAWVFFDEISNGTAVAGVYPIFLPVIAR